MAVFHLACRIAWNALQVPPQTSAPAREAKFFSTCPHCSRQINKGDMISCSRDNTNGARKGTDKPREAGEYRAAPESDQDESDDAPESEPTPIPSVKLGALEQTIANAVLPYLAGKIGADAKAIKATVTSEIGAQLDGIIARVQNAFEGAKPKAQDVNVILPNGEAKDMGRQHKQFATLVQMVASGANVWITGPAGSGKTFAVHSCATALGLEYGYTGSIQDQYALTGYNDAQGRYVRTPMRERYEHGGLFLWDEVDGSDPGALLAFNAMLANGTASFPDGMVKRHETTRLVATANTFGLGANAEYVGRNKLDAAFLDRFVFLSWEYDEELERDTSGNVAWAKRVQYIRERCKVKGMKHLVTPRATYAGAKLIAQGLDQDLVESMVLRKGMTADQWKQVDT